MLGHTVCRTDRTETARQDGRGLARRRSVANTIDSRRRLGKLPEPASEAVGNRRRQPFVFSKRMRSLVPYVAALVAAVPCAPQEASVTTSDPVFTLDVQVVNVMVTVKDGQGRLLTDLTKDDFILSEDGVPQEIAYFAHQTDLPLTIGLLVDTSGSQQSLIPAERSAGMMFFRSLLRQEKDLAFLMSFDRNVELLQDYTGSLRLLERGLSELVVEAPTGGFHPNPTGNKKQTSTALYDALYLAADEMFRDQVGRKAVVVISDGYDVGSKVKFKSAIEAAQRADLVVYTIQYVDRHFARRAYLNVGAGASALNRMASQTGGTAFRVSSGRRLSDIFRQIEEELRGQYSIGYTPKRGIDSRGFRKIVVKSRRKGLKIQARDGYYPDAI